MRLMIQCAIGGLFMGLANLVPGISGGTMLLAAGVYPLFITSIAEITSLRFDRRSLAVLTSVGLAAGLSILLFAGLMKSLVLEYRWVMYSLFIGLTLGGVPVLKRLLGHLSGQDGLNIALGFALMLAVGLSQILGLGADSVDSQDWLVLFVAGTAGASAMILPGVSGGYLLLVLGCYIPILSGIETFKLALKARDLAQIFDVSLGVILPVGAGVVFGVVVVSHILRRCLQRWERQTYGVLLGLLLGAVIGLYPFQTAAPLDQIGEVKSQAVEIVDGVLHYVASAKAVAPKDLPTVYYMPEFVQIVLSLIMVVAGLCVTFAVSWYGGRKDSDDV